MIIEKYTIPGKPTPLQRPRLSKRKTYDPQKQDKIIPQLLLKKQSHKYPNLPKNLPLELNIMFYMPIPKHLSQIKKNDLLHAPHIKKPDLDNLIKFIYDIGNNALYNDDKQIYKTTAAKFYSNNPRTEITIIRKRSNQK